MFLAVKFKKKAFFGILLICAVLLVCFCFVRSNAHIEAIQIMEEEEVAFLIDDIVATRNAAILRGDLDSVRSLYNTNKRSGLWAFEHEKKKLEYLANWSQKQGITFTDVASEIEINWSKNNGQGMTINFMVCSTYTYSYQNKSQINTMRIGTYHELDIVQYEQQWLITREWYTDPFADSLDLESLDTAENRDYILSKETRDFSNLNKRRIDAVAYADQYCGVAGVSDNGFSYNTAYKNYNHLGGDCANFVSQVLYESGFKKNGTWNYEKEGSRAWVNAQALKNYMIYSARAWLIASGSYDKVLKASYKLLPGDIVAYEKKGKITHVSVVTGADSQGYSLVNCHNTDRFRVPWDLGWSNSKIKFHLIRVEY